MQWLIAPPWPRTILRRSETTLHKTIRFAPEVSWLSCVRNAKRFASTLRAIGDGPNCLMTCAHANYVIFFESTTEQVTIVRILHGARDIPEILNPS